MHRRRVGLEMTELLLLLGIQPPLITSLFWRLVKAAVLVGHTPVHSQTEWHTEPSEVKRLLMVLLLLPLSVRAGEIVLPKFNIPWHKGGALTTPQSDRLTKFLEDGLKAAKAAGDKELIKAYEETLEIHYDDPLNPNPLAGRASNYSDEMQPNHGNKIGFDRSKISDCKTENWAGEVNSSQSARQS